ncbi:MAG: NAD-dependent deacylase [Dehalococcoidia bacterium]|nr:MAG: NAD-dependent deacylase [Dehalococcoidia bacterium]
MMGDLILRAANDLKNSQHAIVLTGAGMSTESGLRDFRGPKGLWTTNKEAETKAYERYDLFLRDPRAYWEEMLGKEDAHGAFYNDLRKAEPNAGHYALANLEEAGVIKCVITQNIDGLHPKAGSKNVIEFHGSVNKLRCASCGSRSGFEEDAMETLPPLCHCGGFLKLDVVHFKEPIPLDVMGKAEDEVEKCDVMLICGTSAVVYPFAGLPRAARMSHGSGTVIIEVNAEPTPLTNDGISDYLLQGKLGEILPKIVEPVLKRG